MGRKLKRGLYKHPKGTTWHYYKKIKGKIHAGDTGCTLFASAELWLKKYVDDQALTKAGILLLDAPSLEEALKEWEEAHQHLGQVHRDQMRQTIEDYFSKLLHYSLNKIGTAEIEKVRAAYLAKPGRGSGRGNKAWPRKHTNGGANGMIKLVSSLFGWAIKRGWIRARPWKIERVEAQEERSPVLWPEQVIPFLKVIDSDVIPADQKGYKGKPRNPDVGLSVRMQLGLGLRETESLEARWENVSWRNASFTVTGSTALDTSTKNRKTRDIDLPPWLQEVLEDRWRAAGSPMSGWILPGRQKRPHVTGYTTKAVALAGEKVGEPDLHPNRLRATFATAHYEVGTPLSQIAQFMGHEDPTTTLGHYIVQRPKGGAEAQKKVSYAMGLGCHTVAHEIEYFI
jgi:integrase